MAASQTLGTINSLLRTVMGLVVMVVVAVGGWFGFRAFSDTYYAEDYLQKTRDELADTREKLDESQSLLAVRTEELVRKDAQMIQLQADLEAKQQQIVKLDTALRLLKVDRRVARLTVLDQTSDPETNQPITTVSFVELNDAGEPLDEPRIFPIRGDVIYVDYWVVKFDDKYVEEADLIRSTSLVLFRRIFGEQQQPLEGFPLDQAGGAPRAYAQGGVPSDFEQQIWSDFWTIANDEAKARELGIRAAHGEAVSIKVQEGKTYKLQLRASDGISLLPDDTSPPPARPAA